MRSERRTRGEPAPSYAEFRLDWLIRLSQLERVGSDRRLNAMQNLLSALMERWGGGANVRLGKDVRLSRRTAEALVEWVQFRGPAVEGDADRLLAVTTGDALDESVPDGWIRLLHT